MDTPADSVEVVLRDVKSVSKVKIDDPVTISLGFGSKQTQVFSGIVDAIQASISSLRLLGLSQMVKLMKLRLNQSYLKQNAGDIVKDVCNKTGVSAGDIQDGVALPSFYISHDVPTYDCVRALAERSGYDVYLTPKNKLNFKEYNPTTIHNLAYGKDVLHVEAAHLSPAKGARVFGESPSSMKGSDTAHWLTKDEVEGSAGSGPGLLLSDPAIRDKATADAVARSRLAQARQTLCASIVSYGKPEVKLGDSVNLDGFSNKLLKGGFKVRTVEHSFDKTSGFKTRIVCSKGT